VPRANIYFHVTKTSNTKPNRGPSARHRDCDSETDEIVVPLNFDAIWELEKANKAVLKGYESSEGIMREFCPVCGATVF
jgi:hypothetical protein